MSLKQQIQPLLDEHLRYNGRGNIIPANVSLIKMLQLVIDAADQLDRRLCVIEQAAVDKTNGLEHAYNAVEHVIVPTRPRGRPRKAI